MMKKIFIKIKNKILIFYYESQISQINIEKSMFWISTKHW
jgi:hypothetical protein